MEPKSGGEVTQLLESWRAGEEQALDDLLPLVYSELRKLANQYLRKERAGHTLQSTALVHEAFLRLVDQKRARLDNRNHFFAVASQAMRRVLVDHARRDQANKRIGAHDKVALDKAPDLAVESNAEILAVHQALERLSEIHPRQAQLVELRYFGGLSNPEAAEVLDVSLATIERDWQVARIWLKRKLKG
jgi:RNA polymerase sigma factor (TIGR02999 family)